MRQSPNGNRTQSKIETRGFVVGCARSGTTLLQSMLAAHSAIASFPESHFFSRLSSDNAFKALIGIPHAKLRPGLKEFAAPLNRQGFNVRLPRFYWPNVMLPKQFIHCLDGLAVQMGKSVWIEKTPRHILHIPKIQKVLPSAKFIHIIRNPRDVVASMYEVTHAAPDLWGSREGRSIETCAAQWNQSVSRTLKYTGSENHDIVHFADLTANPEKCLKGICRFLGLPYEPAMVHHRADGLSALVRENEFWKEGVSDEIKFHEGEHRKFLALFNEYERKRIDELTSNVHSLVRQHRKQLEKAEDGERIERPNS